MSDTPSQWWYIVYVHRRYEEDHTVGSVEACEHPLLWFLERRRADNRWHEERARAIETNAINARSVLWDPRDHGSYERVLWWSELPDSINPAAVEEGLYE